MLTLLLLLDRIIRVENKLPLIAISVETQHFQHQAEIEVKSVRQIAGCTFNATQRPECVKCV
ncbi:hypothetical protein CBI35_14220 [Pantoea sp. AV62]|nr:hypothetical protein HA39_08605 [Pantoea brenneri]OXM22807.1 hypothetical protein CBI35_14220 [Pantoea sp. AV62]